MTPNFRCELSMWRTVPTEISDRISVDDEEGSKIMPVVSRPPNSECAVDGLFSDGFAARI